MLNDPNTEMYTAVTNSAGLFSLWRAATPLPDGWRAVGAPAARDRCIQTIERLWPDGPTPAPSGADPLASAVRLFGDTVRRYPERPAVSDRARRLSYAELDSHADVLAGLLRQRGVQRGDHVAFHVRRGVGVFVAMLGILKAGAAYVPVDTRYPDSRRDLMISESGATAVVTEGELAPQIAQLGPPVLELDVDFTARDDRRTAAADPQGVPDTVRAEDAAAVLFTSGSSGRPKAIVLQHHNLLYFAQNPALPALGPDDRVGHVSSVSFDAFHFETWCSFAGGAEVVVLPIMPDLVNSDIQLELKRRRITAMLVPTMAVNHVVRENRDAFSSLRILHTGGDVISPIACCELLDGAFSGAFFNLYGPTECTTACTGYQVTAVDGTVPIGTELTGATGHVLDGNFNEVPRGSVGELHVGGAGVARGYLGQPGLTATRFLPDPYAGGGTRMYATGDLVRRREDGTLDYVGRADDQVKIRGYRVEPREVERVLVQHPQVREAAVLVAGEGEDRHLMAMVVSDDRISPRDMRAYAAEKLPEFMVPSALALVPEIPANEHGKRDLEQLRQLAAQQLRRDTNRAAPRDRAERYLAELWEDLLAVERIGVTDDFFALGGNSLLAFRMQQRIKRQLGVQLEPRDVLTNSELGRLAAVIRERTDAVR